MIGGLEVAEELILKVCIIGDEFNKVHVALDDIHKEGANNFETPASFGVWRQSSAWVLGGFIVFEERVDPGFKHRSEKAEIPTAAHAHVLDVAADDDPRLEAELLGELPEHLVIDNACAQTGEEAFALSGVAFIQVQSNHTA
jgi:hypothetical protein